MKCSQLDEGQQHLFSFIIDYILHYKLAENNNVRNWMKCSQLDEGQQHLFNFIIDYVLHYKLAENNNEFPPKPFQIFLRGAAGVGKSF